MASIATVVTRGYGSFGSVNLLPTLGYGSSGAVVNGPLRINACEVFIHGAQAAEVSHPYSAVEVEPFVPYAPHAVEVVT